MELVSPDLVLRDEQVFAVEVGNQGSERGDYRGLEVVEDGKSDREAEDGVGGEIQRKCSHRNDWL